MKQRRIVVIATHPIQYHVPWFRALAKVDGIDLLVLFGILPDSQQQGTGFGTSFSWDIPLTDGYQWQVLENAAKSPSLCSFFGIDCPGLFGTINELEPDALIITGWQSKMLLQAILAATRLRIKMIVRGESNAKKRRPFYVRWLQRILLTRFNTFLAIGISNKQFYLNNGVRLQAIFDAPYFVDNERFLTTSLNAEGLAAAAPIPASEFCFIYCGKLIEKKNVLELLVGFAKLSQMTKGVHLLIIGDGQLRPQLEDFVLKERLSVTFSGFINQTLMPTMYALGDCLLLGSDYDETWGLAVNEAMVCGLPAIVSDRVGCSDDLIIDGETGYCYAYGNTDELSEKMALMANDKIKAAAMGRRGQLAVAV